MPDTPTEKKWINLERIGQFANESIALKLRISLPTMKHLNVHNSQMKEKKITGQPREN